MGHEIERAVHEAAVGLKWSLGAAMPPGLEQASKPSGVNALLQDLAQRGDPDAVVELEADVAELAKWVPRLLEAVGHLRGAAQYHEIVEGLDDEVDRLRELNND